MKKIRFLILLIVAIGAVFGGYVLNDTINKRNEVQVVSRIGTTGSIHLGNKLLAEEIIVKSISANSRLMVMEAEISEDIIIDDTYFDLSFLRKVKRISFAADGIYAVDMDITRDNVEVDIEKQKITINFNKPYLYSVHINEDNTRYFETETGILRFGDIKLEPEEYSTIVRYVTDNASEKLNTGEYMSLALENAEIAVKALVTALNTSEDNWDIEVAFIE